VEFAAQKMVAHHAHPVAVHSPNGILPAAFLFTLLAATLDLSALGLAAYYNLVFVLLTLPPVLYTGYLEWSRRYRRALTPVFIAKLASAATVSLCALALTVWRTMDPGILNPGAQGKGWYLLAWVVMIAATGLAGHLGGKLVFGGRK
jgi:hypothetical protein